MVVVDGQRLQTSENATSPARRSARASSSNVTKTNTADLKVDLVSHVIKPDANLGLYDTLLNKMVSSAAITA